MIYYFDTSALVKRYHWEKGTERVDSIIESKNDIYFSTLAIAEIISVLTRLKNSNIISKKQYERITNVFFYDLEHRYVPVPLDDSQIVNAIKLIEKYNLRTLDALHLSVALEVKEIGECTFVSSDKKLWDAAAHEGFGILNPEIG